MGSTRETVTFAELDARANQVAQLLRASGVQQGKHIAMMMKNCREFMEIMFGCMRAGVVFTPISTHLKKDETAYIINNCRAQLFIASASLADVAAEAAAQASALEHCFIVGGEKPDLLIGIRRWLSSRQIPLQIKVSVSPCCTHQARRESPRGFFARLKILIWTHHTRSNLPGHIMDSIRRLSIFLPHRYITPRPCTTTH
jgi:fatty-acyl-CoA synthase